VISRMPERKPTKFTNWQGKVHGLEDLQPDLPNKPSGLRKKLRKKLQRRERKKLTTLTTEDIDSSSEFTILRYAILNRYFDNAPRRKQAVSAVSIRKFLHSKNKINHGFKFNIPKKYRNRSVDAMLGKIPFKNLMLWCSNAVGYKAAALHLCMAIPTCEEDDCREKIIHLIGRPCQEGSCKGKYEVWAFTEPLKP